MGYKSVVLVVENVPKAKQMYVDVFDLEVEEDHGELNVGFRCGLSLYDKRLFESISKTKTSNVRTNATILYFEYSNIKETYRKACGKNLEIIHGIEEQPWGQKVFRAYDLDNCVLEVAEKMSACVARMAAQGLNLEELAKKTGYTPAKVERLLNETK